MLILFSCNEKKEVIATKWYELDFIAAKIILPLSGNTLHGSVSKVTKTVYSIGLDGKEHVLNKHLAKFNRNGLMISYEILHSQSPAQIGRKWFTNYEFDDNNRIKRVIKTIGTKESISNIVYDKNGWASYVSDDFGSSNNGLQRKLYYESKNNVVQKMSFYGPEAFSTTRFILNSEGLCEEQLNYSYDDAIESKFKFSYNIFGHMISEIKIDYNSDALQWDTISTALFSYTYDHMNNWTELTRKEFYHDKGNSPETLINVRQEIVYFE